MMSLLILALLSLWFEQLLRYKKIRSVPKQNKPFPTLAEALKKETRFELNNVKGTMVGFRFPSYIREINEPGYHFHFITEDRKAGGHVLQCTVNGVNVEISFLD